MIRCVFCNLYNIWTLFTLTSEATEAWGAPVSCLMPENLEAVDQPQFP